MYNINKVYKITTKVAARSRRERMKNFFRWHADAEIGISSEEANRLDNPECLNRIVLLWGFTEGSTDHYFFLNIED